MTSSWHEMALGDVIELKRGYDLPQRERRPGSVPIVSSGGISDYHDTAKVAPPGVVTGRYGTLGNVFFIQEPYWPLNTSLYVRDFKGNDPRFISYFLKSVDFLAYSDKAAVPGLNRNHLHQARVRIPPLPEQRRIAHILGTLDDKIELNRRMNATLEAIARALFKSWFVDFDPVRAKAEGRDPGLPADLAALFPAALVESEIGDVPEGWGVSTLATKAQVTSGKRPSEKSPTSTSQLRIPLYGGGGRMGYVSTPLYERPIIITGRVGTLGKFFRVTQPIWASDNTLVVVPKRDIDFEFLFLALSGMDVGMLNRGSTQPLLTQGDLGHQVFPYPTPKVIGAFHRLTAPLFAKADANKQQSTTLAALRDTLLPRLLSGALRVADDIGLQLETEPID